MTQKNIETLAYLIDVARYHNTNLKIMFTYLVSNCELSYRPKKVNGVIVMDESRRWEMSYKWICKAFNISIMNNGVKNHLLEHYPFYRILLGCDTRTHDTVLGEAYQKDAGKGSYARTNKQQNTALHQMMLDQIRKKAIEVLVRVRNITGVLDHLEKDLPLQSYRIESQRGSCHNELVFDELLGKWNFKPTESSHYIHPFLDNCDISYYLADITAFYMARNLKIHLLEQVKATPPSMLVDAPESFIIRYLHFNLHINKHFHT